MSRSWRNLSETVQASGEESAFLVAEKEVALRCSLQLMSEMRQYTPSTDQKQVEFLNYGAETEVVEDRL